MEASVIQSDLYPSHRCKTLHLVRHAQGTHNVASAKNHDALLSYELFDAPLSSLGWEQVDNLREYVQTSGLSNRIESVIVSPLLRTLQTAAGVFGDEAHKKNVKASPLMVANTGNSNRSEISSLNSPPVIAIELCRERLGVHPCDKRRSVSECKTLFPAIDFSQIESEDDILWKPEVRENNEELAARGLKFFNWLCTRKEKEIAIVTHSAFLSESLKAFYHDSHSSVKTEVCKWFSNCELRSLVIVDKR